MDLRGPGTIRGGKGFERSLSEVAELLPFRRRDASRVATPIIVLVDEFFGGAIDPSVLARLYKDGGGECPTFRDFEDKPCSKSRFGCWTCTVVRKDRSAANLISSGHNELIPFSGFREWLVEMRNDPSMRCKRRRNGSPGLGPFTIEARLLILSKLSELEKETGRTILSREQRNQIAELIEADSNSPEYVAIEGL